MGSSVRVAISAALAVPVVIALFLIMFKLIDRDYQLDDEPARKIADIVVPDKTIDTNLKEVKPEKVDDPEPPPDDLPPLQADIQLDMNIGNTAPITGVNLNLNASGMSSGDGEYLPIVKVAPIYPRRALTRGLEGWVLLEFTVTKLGTVVDIKVLESDPPNIFDKAAVSAAAKFKYKPKVVNGEPIDTAGVLHRISFELED